MPASAQDFEYYYSVRSRGMRPHVERLGRTWDETYERRYHQDHFHPEFLRMAFVNGTRVGFVGVRPMPDRQSTSIESFCLEPSLQGKGLGSRILNTVLTNLDEAGQIAELDVMPGNPVAKLFERFGFRREETGRTDDLIYYRRVPRIQGPSV